LDPTEKVRGVVPTRNKKRSATKEYKRDWSETRAAVIVIKCSTRNGTTNRF